MKIAGITIKHGNNDFEYWEGFSLTKDEENVIWNILNKHDIEGCSVRGTWKEIIDEMKEW